MTSRRIYLLSILLGVVLLSSIVFSVSPVSATFPYPFEGEPFAIVIDLNTGGSDPDILRDLNNGTTWPDSEPDEDREFFLSYLEQDGVEAVYSGLLKYENNVTLGDVYPSYRNALRLAGLDRPLFYINATAPFQQLVEYFQTPAGDDIFVANNFMGLVAYSANATDKVLDAEDEIYLGYTFALSNLLTAINNSLTGHGADLTIRPFNAVPFFESTVSGYEFGITYHNMLVVWQSLDVEPANPLAGSFPSNPEFPSGIVYGQGLKAVTLFDSLEFTYSVSTTDLGDDLLEISINSTYDIGETKLLVTTETSINSAEYPDSYVASPSYTLNLPPAASIIPGFPSSVDINLPDLAFYVNDDAQKRIHDQAGGFGISVMSATNVFGMDVELPVGYYDDATESIPIYKEGDTENPVFLTKFVDKDIYKLLGVEELGYDPTDDHEIGLQIRSPTGWALPSATATFLKFKSDLVLAFTKWVAMQLSPSLSLGDISMYAGNSEYITFIEYPEWSGGQIVNDPTFSAIVGTLGESETTTSQPTSPILTPGFEFLPLFAGCVAFILLIRKRKNKA
ncbi:MAG: Heimdall-CTERM domain-containing surface protein [Promethearchaeota archaeon]